jgi:hypothetical protein
VKRTPAERAVRREQLLAESETYREGFAGALESWDVTLGRVDRVMEVTAAVRRLAPWLGMAVGGAMFLVPKGAAAWIGRAQNAWKSVGSILSIVSGLRG